MKPEGLDEYRGSVSRCGRREVSMNFMYHNKNVAWLHGSSGEFLLWIKGREDAISFDSVKTAQYFVYGYLHAHVGGCHESQDA